MKHILLLLCFPLALSATAQELDSGEAFSRLSSVRDDLDLAGNLLDSPELGCRELWRADNIIDKAIQKLLAVSCGLPKLKDHFSLIEPIDILSGLKAVRFLGLSCNQLSISAG